MGLYGKCHNALFCDIYPKNVESIGKNIDNVNNKSNNRLKGIMIIYPNLQVLFLLSIVCSKIILLNHTSRLDLF